MILYHTVTTYHILKSVLHKLNYHPNEEAAILIPSFLLKVPKGLTDINEQSVFSTVIVYDWERKYNGKFPEDAFEAIENKLYDVLGKNLLQDCFEINVFRSAFLFGSYLASKGIKFNWFEEADGRYSNPFPLMEDDERLNYDRYALANGLGLYTGDNEAVNRKFISINSQIMDVQESDIIVDFDTLKELDKLDNHSQQKLLEFFGVDGFQIDVEANSALLLTQHVCNMKIMTMEHQILMYKLTMDYFMNGYKVYIKAHPSDLVAYKDIFPEAEILRNDYPSELLSFMTNHKFKMAAAISSTGINNVCLAYKSKLLMDEEYFNTFFDNDLYYFVCTLLEKLDRNNIYTYGVNQKQMEAMIDFGGFIQRVHFENIVPSEITNSENAVFIVGKKTPLEILKSLAVGDWNNVVFILMDIQGYQEELDMLDKYAFSVKKLKISKIKPEKHCNLESQKYVYVLSDNQDVIERVNKMEYEKLLLNIGVKVRVDANTDKDIQIAVLAGMLEATERTLKKCYEENRILKGEQ